MPCLNEPKNTDTEKIRLSNELSSLEPLSINAAIDLQSRFSIGTHTFGTKSHMPLTKHPKPDCSRLRECVLNLSRDKRSVIWKMPGPIRGIRLELSPDEPGSPRGTKSLLSARVQQERRKWSHVGRGKEREGSRDVAVAWSASLVERIDGTFRGLYPPLFLEQQRVTKLHENVRRKDSRGRNIDQSSPLYEHRGWPAAECKPAGLRELL